MEDNIRKCDQSHGIYLTVMKCSEAIARAALYDIKVMIILVLVLWREDENQIAA